jgi:DNA-directed RNA polymerase subunit RPC12/RpoP
MSERACLIVRRLVDLDTSYCCARCGHQVAVFPAAQEAKRHMPSLEFVCMICQPISEGDIGLTAGIAL